MYGLACRKIRHSWTAQKREDIISGLFWALSAFSSLTDWIWTVIEYRIPFFIRITVYLLCSTKFWWIKLRVLHLLSRCIYTLNKGDLKHICVEFLNKINEWINNVRYLPLPGQDEENNQWLKWTEFQGFMAVVYGISFHIFLQERCKWIYKVFFCFRNHLLWRDETQHC